MAKLQLLLIAIFALVVTVQASIGDKLPEFKECVKVLESLNALLGSTNQDIRSVKTSIVAQMAILEFVRLKLLLILTIYLTLRSSVRTIKTLN